MKNQKQVPELKVRPFNGAYYPTIKRIRTEQRQRIRQLLRSFIPFGGIAAQTESDNQ